MFRRLFNPKAEFFALDPKFFPESTQSVFPIELVLSAGVLPLGYKGEKLNVGFLDPESKADLASVKAHLGDQRFQRFEIHVDQMLAVLQARYRISDFAIRQMARSELHPKIQKHFEG